MCGHSGHGETRCAAIGHRDSILASYWSTLSLDHNTGLLFVDTLFNTNHWSRCPRKSCLWCGQPGFSFQVSYRRLDFSSLRTVFNLTCSTRRAACTAASSATWRAARAGSRGTWRGTVRTRGAATTPPAARAMWSSPGPGRTSPTGSAGAATVAAR